MSVDIQELLLFNYLNFNEINSHNSGGRYQLVVEFACLKDSHDISWSTKNIKSKTFCEKYIAFIHINIVDKRLRSVLLLELPTPR